jgi:hypothetical protein
MRLSVLCVLGLLLAAPVAAQTPAPAPAAPAAAPSKPQTRSGVWFSGGLGYGTLGCDDCDGERESGLSGGLSVGGTVTPRFLIGVATVGFSKSEDGDTLTAGTFEGRIRFYPWTDKGFHINAGAGLATLSFAGESETGFGLTIGIGHDFRVGKNVSLTPFWNGTGMSFDGVGVNLGQIGLAVTIH